MLEYRNLKIFLQKLTLQIEMLLVISMVKKLLERLTEKNCKKQINNGIELKK